MNTSQTKIDLTRNFLLLIVCASLLLTPNTIMGWQDDTLDPFATDDSDVQDATIISPDGPAVDLDESLSDGVKLIIRSLRESNPSTPVELARAINSLVNVNQYDEARRYVDELIGLNSNGPELFDLIETVGPDFFLAIQEQPEFQPAGREFAIHVFKVTRTEAYAPNRINQLISELSDDNRFVRQEAFRQLRLLGAPAVAVMLQVCEDQNRRTEIPFVQSALKKIGTPAMFPLIGAARADGTVAQAVAIGALSNIQSSLALDPLLRASISSRVPKSVRAIAAEAVARFGLNSQFEIQENIFERANAYLDGTVSLPAFGDNQAEIWHWDFADKKLNSTVTSLANASRIMSVDMARDLFQLEPSNYKYRQLQILTVLDATKRVLGPNRVIRPDEVTQFVNELNADELNAVLKTAMSRNLQNGAVAAAELLGQLGDPFTLLTSDGTPSNLVNAILDGSRSLQFAAAKAIAQIDPKQAFPGCSYVTKIITLMANSSGSAGAVAADSREETAQTLASLIFRSGRIGVTANSSPHLIEILETDPDIEFVLITDSFARPHYQDLVQHLRNYWLTKNLPIGLLTRDPVKERNAEQVLDSDPLTLVLPITNDPGLVNRQIARLIALDSGMQVSNVQRDQHTDFALNWINKILADQESYGFYQLLNYRDQLAKLFNHPGSQNLKRDMLLNLGTPQSQLIMTDSANDLSFSDDDRKLMAEAFATSVELNGVLLTKAEIRRQYERYDARQRHGNSTREILGIILDAIESRMTKQRGVFTNTRH